MFLLSVYKDYQRRMDAFQKKARSEKLDTFECWQQRKLFVERFKKECEIICSNESELCDIVIDICYRAEKTKQFAWDICGNVILNNLLRNKNGIIHFPKLVEQDGEFEYCGEKFVMYEKKIGSDIDDYSE